VSKYRPHLFVACILAAILLTGIPAALKNFLVDQRFQLVTRPASGDIVLVAIDTRSIEGIGVWPWPRRTHAETIKRLVAAGARDIAFDVDFSSPSDAASDQAFADALRAAGGAVILPAFQQAAFLKDPQAVYVNRPLARFAKDAWTAVVNVPIESDGVVRRYPVGRVLDGRFVPSMGLMLAGRYQQSTENTFWIDFGIRLSSVPIVSYADVLRGDPAVLQRLQNKHVIIGGTAVELGDRFNIPSGTIISGPLLQVLAAEAILQDRALHAPSAIFSFGGAALVVLLMIALWGRLSAAWRVVALIAIAAAAEIAATALQSQFPLLIDTSLLHIAGLAYLGAIALHEIDFRDLLGRIAERRFQRIAMSLGDGLVCADRDGVITMWNPGAEAIFANRAEDMVGRPLHSMCPSGDGHSQLAVRTVLDLPQAELQAPGGKLFELTGRRGTGEAFALEACFFGWQGADGFQYGALLRDISVRKREAQRIRYLAEHDTVTGLANRHSLYDHLAARFTAAAAEHQDVALLVIGLDKFHVINNMLGHAYGDHVLRGVADRLRELTGGRDFMARPGGDEFAIVVGGADAAARARELADWIVLAFGETPLIVGVRHQLVTVGVGVAIHPQHGATADDLLGNAYLALNKTTTTKKINCVVFDHGIRDELEVREKLEVELADALKGGQFELFYQPQISLKDRKLTGAEALIRWRHPRRGIVMPGHFMTVANGSAISDEIASWVMRTACRQGALWQQAGLNLRLGVNLSPSQLQSNELVATVRKVLADTEFSPALLELEVTEDILLADGDRALDIFRAIQALGVRILFDDFGTGYASLSYLKKFPLNGLKIDRSFVRELQFKADDQAIVGSTIALSKQLGLTVIAEGIEDDDTAEFLARLGCDEGQGFVFGRPMPAADFENKILRAAAA
jgi:diguanylate cyclase (GGDEF)-like protein/PAS domain S-box-containing protein